MRDTKFHLPDKTYQQLIQICVQGNRKPNLQVERGTELSRKSWYNLAIYR